MSSRQFLWSFLFEPLLASAKYIVPQENLQANFEQEAVVLINSPWQHPDSPAFRPEMSASTPEVETMPPPQEMPLSSGAWLEAIPDFVPLEQAGQWQPMLRALGPNVAAEFTWAATTDTIQTYEHRQTHRYLHIDGLTGEFLNQQCVVISAEAALEHARRPAAAKVAQPEPAVKACALDSEPAAQPAEVPFRDSLAEPPLNAFTRQHGLDPDAPFWSAFVSRLEPLQSGLSNRLGLLAEAKQKFLAKTPGWHTPAFSSGHESALAGGNTPDAQQPTFATFTRRTSAL